MQRLVLNKLKLKSLSLGYIAKYMCTSCLICAHRALWIHLAKALNWYLEYKSKRLNFKGKPNCTARYHGTGGANGLGAVCCGRKKKSADGLVATRRQQCSGSSTTDCQRSASRIIKSVFTSWVSKFCIFLFIFISWMKSNRLFQVNVTTFFDIFFFFC